MVTAIATAAVIIWMICKAVTKMGENRPHNRIVGAQLFWTQWVRGIAKVGMAISIIASLICGGLLISIGDELFTVIGIAVMIIGILISITSIAMIMMISEISINTYNTYAVLKNEHPNDQQPNSVISPQVHETITETQPTTGNTDNSWVCRCGTRNAAASRYCKNCGKSKVPSSYAPKPPKTNPNDSWVCKCGKRNPNSTEFCANCKRRKESQI